MCIAVYRLELPQLIRHMFRSSKVYYFRTSKFVQHILSFTKSRKFKKIDTDTMTDFSSIHAHTMNTCTEYLFNSFGRDCISVQFIAKKLDGQIDAAKSYYLKSLAARRLFDVMLYAASLKTFEEQENIYFTTVCIPKDIKLYLDALPFDSQKRRFLYQHILHDYLRLGLYLCILLRRCILARNTQDSSSEKKVKYATELIDLSCFKGDMGHPDSIEKLFGLPHEDVAYFKFAFNTFKSAIRKNSSAEIRDFVKDNNFNYINLDSLKAKSISKLTICRYMLEVLFKRAFFLIDTIILIDFLIQLYAYHALFDNFPSITKMFTFTFPSGRTAWRWNSGVITAISRLHNVESIGCQTRAFYLYKFEDVLDCFDRFYFWSPHWYKAFEKYMQHVRHIDYLKDLSLATHTCSIPAQKTRQTNTITAVAFPSDCCYSHHYNRCYNANFLKALFAICERFKNLRILFKAKDPENIAVYRENPEIDRLFNDYCDQMIIVEKKRGDVWDLIESADMTIGIGFTNPALQAALADRKVLIYEELKYYNSYLNSIGMQIASSIDEFTDKCGRIIEEILQETPVNKNNQLSEQL